jgi:hypothetical protein
VGLAGGFEGGIVAVTVAVDANEGGSPVGDASGDEVVGGSGDQVVAGGGVGVSIPVMVV